ncbi:MAG: CcmD family protein [Pseudodesulfovibrio sp.]|jgi:CcmD family protein|nr:CcmD family protein [Pseudodesulfovibrio sp.]
MSTATYLFIANGAVWLGVAGYLVFLAAKSSGLEKRVQQLELLGEDNDG